MPQQIGRAHTQYDPQHNADQTADEADHNGLDDKLQPYGAVGRAQRLAGADLPGPLGDGHQHNVHNADASHQQRDARDHGDGRGDGGHHIRHDLHHGSHAERHGLEIPVVAVIGRKKAGRGICEGIAVQPVRRDHGKLGEPLGVADFLGRLRGM